MTSGTGTILRTHGISFTSGQVYTVWREYIGGNISIQNNTGTSLVIDTIVKNSDDGPSTRNNNDAGVDSRGSSNLTINSASQNEADGFKFWIWLNTGTTVTFDNYQIRIYVCYDNLLPNWSLSNVGTMPNPMDTNNNLTVYSVNNAIADMPAGTKFVQVNNRWFKVEPIRWRVTDYATTLKVTTAGGWEIIGQSINVKTNTDYTLSLNYSTPSAGIPNFMVLSASPQNNNCSSISIASYQLSGNSKGEINLTFNSGSYSQVYVILNFGYVNDGTTYTFEFGNLRISDKSVEIEENISKWTKYQYSNAFSISETSAVASNGVMTNYTAVSDKVLTVGAVTSSLSSVDEGWSFMKSGNMISKITSNYTVSGNNISITYNASSQSFTLTNTSSSDPYATINHTVSLTKGVKYRMYMEVTNSSGASVGNNTVQVFYAINAGYSEAYSLRFGGSATWKEFTAPTTGVYKIRFDNDYGNTLIIKNFQIELVSDNGNQLVDGVDGAYDLFSSAFKYSRSDIVDIDLFGYSNQQIKIYTTTGTSEGLRVASVEEIEENLSEISAKASDMVCFLLDKNAEDKVNYWTRNLGSSLDNGQVVTSAGTIKSNWLNKQNGVRFAITMTVGS